MIARLSTGEPHAATVTVPRTRWPRSATSAGTSTARPRRVQVPAGPGGQPVADHRAAVAASLLLLTQADFKEVYQPRNLYVWSPTPGPGARAGLRPPGGHQRLRGRQPDQRTAGPTRPGGLEPRPGWSADHDGLPARAHPDRNKVTSRPDGDREPGGAAAGPARRSCKQAQQMVTLTSTSYPRPSPGRSTWWSTAELVDSSGAAQPARRRASPAARCTSWPATAPSASGAATARQPSRSRLAGASSRSAVAAVLTSHRARAVAGAVSSGRGCTVYTARYQAHAAHARQPARSALRAVHVGRLGQLATSGP